MGLARGHGDPVVVRADLLRDIGVLGRAVADLTLGYRFQNEGWGKGLEIQANVTNLTDEDYISTVGSGGFTNRDPNGLAMTLLPAPPRQGFVTIKKAF